MSAHYQESWFRAVTRSAAQIWKRFGVPDQLTEGEKGGKRGLNIAAPAVYT